MLQQTDELVDFSEEYNRGDVLQGVVSSFIQDIGLIVDLCPGVFGIVHLSDLDWTEPPEAKILEYSIEQPVAVRILAIDLELERISLGIKQLYPPPGRPGDLPPSPEPCPINRGPSSPSASSTLRMAQRECEAAPGDCLKAWSGPKF